MSRKFALIIGNSEYIDEKFTCLKTPDADVRGLAEVLREPTRGGFDDVLTLVNKTESEIRRVTERFFAKKKSDDLLLLYFSGHGVLDDQGRLYLAATDTEYELWSASAIPATFITDNMDRSQSKRQILILDCCHSGAFARGAKAVMGAKAVTKATFEGNGYGKVVLTATDTTQYAWENEDIIGETENSVFTHFLIDGLKNGVADTNNDGEITLNELYDHVHKSLINASCKQTPTKWVYNQQGEIVIAANPMSQAIPPALAELIEDLDRSSIRVRDDAVRELEEWLLGRNTRLSLVAREALERVSKDDDSNKVRNLAADILERNPPVAAETREDEKRLKIKLLNDEADAAIAKREWIVAVDKLTAVLDLQPDKTEAEAKLIDVQDKLEKERQEDQKRIKIDELHTDANAAIAKSDSTVAVDKLEAILSLEPNQAEAAAKLKEVNAQQMAEETEEQTRMKISDLFSAVETARASEDLESAVEKLEALLVLTPGHTETVVLLNEVRKQQAKQEEEKQTRIRIAELQLEAQTAESNEEWPKAIEKLQAILELDQAQPDASQRIENARLQLQLAKVYSEGQKYYAEQNWPEALRCFERTKELKGDYKDIVGLIEEVTKKTSNGLEKPIIDTPRDEEPILWPNDHAKRETDKPSNRKLMRTVAAVLGVVVIVVVGWKLFRGDGFSGDGSQRMSDGQTTSQPSDRQATGASPGKPFRNSKNIEMVWIPPGSFDMGSNNGSSAEKPVHRVTISQGFFMGKYEVTQEQWQAVMGTNPSYFKGDDNLPVEQISWNDAQEFVNKLNEMNDGYKYRMPTEAEWEYACRAGTTGDYYGQDVDDIAWYSDNSGQKTHKVGTKQPNAFELYDMSGNVEEWCHDWYVGNYEGAPTDGSARLTEGEMKYRVLRSGTWYYDATDLRSAGRYYFTPGNRSFSVGFRLVAVVRTQ